MSVAKVIEVIAEGETIEKAIEDAISHVTKTVKHVKQLNVEHIEAVVADNKVSKYRINAKVTFVVQNGS